MSNHNASKRDFVRKAAYVAPAILSLQAFSSLAKAGSAYDPSGDAPEVEKPVNREAAKQQARCERREARINSRRDARGKDPIDLDC